MFAVTVGFQTFNKMCDQCGEGVIVNISGFFDSGVDREKLLLLAETIQIKTVIENGAFFSDDVRIGSVRYKAR